MDRNQKLVELYSKCLANSYNDMSDETQQLKVKVFAMDLGLKYKKIEDLYDEAKRAYEQHQANQERNAILKKKQEEAKALREKMQENAKLAFTVESTHHTTVDVFRCEDGSVFARQRDENKFSLFQKNEIYSNLSISVKSSTISNYQYHPSKTIFTGASSGGIAMGGFHTTEAHYTANQIKTAKGYIEFGYGESRITIKEVTLAPEIATLYRRNKDFRYNFNSKNTATCQRDTDNSPFMNAALQTSGHYNQMELVGLAVDSARIPYSDCVQIADILNGIIHNKLPEQDEEIYTKAVKFSQTKDLPHLAEAVNRFEYIKDYKDSEKILGEIKPIYEALLQEKKENEVIRREKTAKKKKLIMAIIAIIAVIGVVVTSVIYGSIQKNMSYENAKAHLDSGRYEEAIDAFSRLGNYKDSAKLVEQSKEDMYNHALKLIDEGDSIAAYNEFKKLNGYKDSATIIEQIDIGNQKMNELYNVEIITDDVIKQLKELFVNNKYVSNEYLEEKVYCFDCLCDVEWEYSSGDVMALSMMLKEKKAYRTITTSLYREYGWDTKTLTLLDGENTITKIGISGGSTFKYDKETKIITIKETAFVSADVTVVLHSPDILEIIVEKSDGSTYSCKYKRAQ